MFSQLGRIREYPVLFPLSQYVFGVVLGLLIGRDYPAFWYLPSISLSLFLTGIFWGKHAVGLKIAAVAILFVWLGIFICGRQVDRLYRKIPFDLSVPRRIEGVVLDFPNSSNGRTTFKIKATRVLDRGDKQAAGSIIKVTVVSEDLGFSKGDRVALLSWLKRFKAWRIGGNDSLIPARNSLTPNFKGNLKDKIEIEKVSEGNFYDRFISGSLDSIRASLPTDYDKDALGVLGGTMIGDKTGLSRDIKRAFKSTGLIHILVVSGFNIGLVFAFFFFLFKFIFARSKRLLMNYDVNLLSTAAAFLPSIFYGQLTGLPYPTLRSVLMLALFISCVFLSRPAISLNVLFWVGFIITLIDPLSLFDISFELSFVAVFGLIYGVSKIRQLYLEKFKPDDPIQRDLLKTALAKIKLYFADLLAASTLAFLFTLPISLYYFSTFSTIGIAANLFFVPIFSFLIFPIGLLGMISAIFGLPFTKLIWLIDLFIIEKTNWCIELLAKIPFSLVKTEGINFFTMFVYYLLLISALAFVKFKWLKKEAV